MARGDERSQHSPRRASLLWTIATRPTAADEAGAGARLLDPCGRSCISSRQNQIGSATTALAALRLGRRVICIERDATYAALSRDRIQAELSSSTLAAHRAGQLPLLR